MDMTRLGGRGAPVRRVAALAVLVLTAGCSTTAGDDPAPAGPTPGSPGETALAYMRDVADGDFTSAAQHVMPDEQGMVQALALGDGSGTTPRVWGDVSLGTVEASGDSATVTFVGRLCRSASGSADPEPVDAECIEENDVRSTSPYFLVHLALMSPTEWRVTFYPSMPGESS